MTPTCKFLISEDFYCGNPTPHRAAFCDFHAGIAAICKAEVSNRAGAVGVKAEWRLGVELGKLPKATGTRGQGRPSLGGSKSEPPKSDAPTLAEIGVDKKRSTRSQKLATLSPEKIDETVAALTMAGKAVSTVTILGLNPFTCRWPIGDPSSDDFRFCGASSPVDRPYCERCCELAYEPATRRAVVKFAHTQNGQ